MNRIITLEDLTSRCACVAQVEKFEIAYPNGFEVTGENLLEAMANGFDVSWTRCMLSHSALEAYDAACAPALEDYTAVRGSAYAAYLDVVAPAKEVYDAACDSAREDHLAANAPARKTYEAAIAPAKEVYEAVRVPAYEVYEVVYTKALADALNGEQA
jgi:hypothetical protein